MDGWYREKWLLFDCLTWLLLVTLTQVSSPQLSLSSASAILAAYINGDSRDDFGVLNRREGIVFKLKGEEGCVQGEGRWCVSSGFSRCWNLWYGLEFSWYVKVWLDHGESGSWNMLKIKVDSLMISGMQDGKMYATLTYQTNQVIQSHQIDALKVWFILSLEVKTEMFLLSLCTPVDA
ncbi:hypothetical protein NE237_028271 [Protea cynaroides]|uniref:Uncharacterized protein n=1 Tax=Protea cynaroides TaxID=273540 RepID=A0A9Q0JSQ3_9MAGN|nr:hypothetical protein NE237_028271 [Protea cynaroides]